MTRAGTRRIARTIGKFHSGREEDMFELTGSPCSLNPARRASQDLRDEADYSRPVLAVRNASILSTSKEEGE